MKISGNL